MDPFARFPLGLSTNLLNNPLDVLETVRFLLPPCQVVELELEEGARHAFLLSEQQERRTLSRGLASLARAEDRTFVVHASWSGPALSLSTPRTGYVEIARCSLLFAVQVAVDIGARMVVFHPGRRHDQPATVILSNLLANLQPVVEVARQEGVSLSCEIMTSDGDDALLSLDDHLRLWAELQVGTCLDLVHAARRTTEQAALESFVSALAPVVTHVHVADARFGRHRHMPIGRGELDVLGILEQLADLGYKGTAVVEEWNRGFRSDEYVTAARDLLPRREFLHD